MKKNNKNNTKAFTLIEVLVVVFILSIISLFVTLRINMRHQDTLNVKNILQQLKLRIDYARLRAISGQEYYGLIINEKGYTFRRFLFLPQQISGIWQEVTTKPLAGFFPFPESSRVKLLKQTSGGSLKAVHLASQYPQITISANNEVMPFILQISLFDSNKHYMLHAQDNGTIRIKHNGTFDDQAN